MATPSKPSSATDQPDKTSASAAAASSEKTEANGASAPADVNKDGKTDSSAKSDASEKSSVSVTTEAPAKDGAEKTDKKDSGSRKPDLSVNFAGIHFKNPIIAAAGTFGYGIEFEDIVTLEKLGGFVTKGLSREPMVGNPPPRLFETAAGMLNSIGLQNIGARAFISEKLPKLAAKKNVVVICNVFGYTREDYVETIHILNDAEGIAAYELNVSCPNTHEGGMVFGTNRTMLEELVANCKSASRRPIIVKLSPNVTSIPAMAKAAENAGADAISLVNTFVGMAIDPETRKPRISNITAGLSGPAIKPIALRMVYEAAHTVEIPVIGMGGISTASDVVEYMLAGAAAVQVGTANFWDPVSSEKIVDGLQRWCVEHHVKKVVDLIGAMET
jgi:dihydroorotate dehydrogenase (NAD+) catalytic subunit